MKFDISIHGVKKSKATPRMMGQKPNLKKVAHKNWRLDKAWANSLTVLCQQKNKGASVSNYFSVAETRHKPLLISDLKLL